MTSVDVNPILYKFYKAGTAVKALESRTLGFTMPNRFNDPYELLPKIISHPSAEKILERKGKITNRQREEIRRRWNTEYQTSHSKANFNKYLKSREQEMAAKIPEELSRLPAQLAKDVVDIVSRELGVLCLSKQWNHHLMWGHYSEGHAGFCIGYQIPAEIPGVYRAEVRYSQERYPIRNSDILLGKFSRRDVEGIMRTKSPEWAYEQEVRYVLNITIPGIPSSIDKSQFYIRHPPGVVKEIIAGIRCTPAMVARMNRICKDLFPEASMYNAVQSGTTYEILRDVIQSPSL